MAINEVDILLQRKDREGNIEINYPLTTAENVTGLAHKLQNYVHKSEKNQPFGYAGLDEKGRISGQIMPEDLAAFSEIQRDTAEKIKAHNEDSQAHSQLYNRISEVEARLGELEILFNGGSNGFSVSFEDIDHVHVTGVWNKALKRIEF